MCIYIIYTVPVRYKCPLSFYLEWLLNIYYITQEKAIYFITDVSKTKKSMNCTVLFMVYCIHSVLCPYYVTYINITNIIYNYNIIIYRVIIQLIYMEFVYSEIV